MTDKTSIAELAIAELLGEVHTPSSQVLYLEHRPVLIYGTKAYRADLGDNFAGVVVPVVLERVGWAMDGVNRDGSIRSNPSSVKLLTEIWPVIRGTPGDTVSIYAGGQGTPESLISWQGPFPFIIGSKASVQPLIEAPYLAFRVQSLGQHPWALVGITLEIKVTGEVYA